MDDQHIVELFWARSENAISETAKKYNNYCYAISYNIVRDSRDAEECVNDTFLRVWHAIPPKKPNRLSTFLGKITRNLSLNKYTHANAQKRGQGQTDQALSELEYCVPSTENVEQVLEAQALTESIDKFLSKSSKLNRMVFVRRYWYLDSILDIAKRYGMSESKVKSMLFRMRNQLKVYLEKEGML